MKKTLRTILAGAVALLAVSCYDDSELKDQNAALQEDLDSFKESLIDASQLGLSRSDIFIAYNGSKSATLTSENIAEYYVMAKPDGWKASFEESTLTIKAPTKEAALIGAAELSGEILIHATSNTGACKVAKLAVTSGDAAKLTVENGNITVFNSLVETTTNWEGETSTNFVDMYVGFIPANDFLAYENPQAFFESAFREYFWGFPSASFANIIFNKDNSIPTAYVEGEYEEFNHTLPIAEFAAAVETVSDGFTYDPNENYVIWSLPASSNAYYDYADYVFTKPITKLAVDEAELADIQMTLSLFGADEFYLSVYAKNMIAPYLEAEGGFESYLTMGPYGMGGPWASFLGGNVNDMGKKYAAGVHTINLSDIYTGYEPISPETEYYVLAFPYIKGKSHDSYVFADDVTPYLLAGAATAGLTLNENLKAEVTYTVTPFTITRTITPPNGGKTHYYLATAEEAETMTDEFFHYNAQYNYVEEADTYTETYNISPESTYYLYTYSVAGGEKGKIEKIEIKTSAVAYDNNVSVTLTSLEPKADDDKTFVATFSVTGANKIGVYVNADGKESNVVKYAFGDSYSLKRALVENGTATVEIKPYTYTTLYVVGYNVTNTELDGESSNVTSVGNVVKYVIADELAK